MLPEHTDVLIVGAGPTGLALAVALRQAGVDHVLIDRLAEGQNTSRAGVIHAHTLEILESIGVTEEMTERGLKMHRFTVRDRDRALVRLRLERLPSVHPYMLMLPQDVTEKILAKRLAALGGTIHRGAVATAIDQDAAGARVTIVTAEGQSSVSARYVVGGDGMHSVVRSAAGIEFDGAAYADSFLLADVEMDWPLGATEVSLYLSPKGLLVIAPLPNGTFRIVATSDNPPAEPSLGDVQELMDARGPADASCTIRAVVWSSRFRIHHRLAKAYRQGRLFVMGDAAHVHSPAGGQGMNTGLVDAVVLGRLLAGVIRGSAPESALDQYQQLRRPAAEKVLGLAGLLTNMATLRGPVKRGIRNVLLSLLDMFPPFRRRLLMNLSGLSRRGLAEVPAIDAGARRDIPVPVEGG